MSHSTAMKSNYLILILLIFSVHLFANYVILEKSSVAMIYDEGSRITKGLSFFRLIFHDKETAFSKKIDILATLKGQYHPPFYMVTEAFVWRALEFFKITDNVNLMILITNSLFLFITIFSVFGIGAMIYKNKNVGILAVFLLSVFPLVFGNSRIAMLDFPLMAMVSLTFYLLYKTNGFNSLLFSILCGISFAFAQLTKESAIIFILPPFFYYFIVSLLKDGGRRGRILNFCVAACFFILISGSIYFKHENFSSFQAYFLRVSYIKHHPDPFFYFRNFSDFTGPMLFIVFFPLFLRYLLNIARRDRFVFLWFLVPCILFSLSPHKNLRIISPIFPAISLIMSGEAFNFLSGKIKKIFIAVLIFIAVFQYLLFNFGFLDVRLKEDHIHKGILSVQSDKYAPVSSALTDIFMKEAKANNDGNKNILFLFNIGEIRSPLRLNIHIRQLPFKVFSFMEMDEVDILKHKQTDWEEKLLSADYIIDKVPYVHVQEHTKQIMENLQEIFARHRNKFKIISEIGVFDGSKIYVYKRNS